MEGPARRSWWDRNLTIAVITAMAAILGAGVGAGATYYGNRSLQEEQSEAAARGVARVLSSQLAAAQGRFEAALIGNYLVLPETATSVSLSTRDQQLLAANLDSDAWDKVSLAFLHLQIERRETEPSPLNMPALEAQSGRRVPLSPRMRELDEAVRNSLRDAIEALRPLAES